MIGAGYAAGMSGKRNPPLRHQHVAHNRTDVMRRMMRARAGKLRDICSAAGWATQRGSTRNSCANSSCRKACRRIFPDCRSRSRSLRPISICRCEVVFSEGPLRRALAASISLPTIMRPVEVDGQVLVDGGATNPLPFEHLRGLRRHRRGGRYFGADLRRQARGAERARMPLCDGAGDDELDHSARSFGTGAPDLLLQPNVGSFRALGFLQASAILRAADPVKAEFKEKLAKLIEA